MILPTPALGDAAVLPSLTWDAPEEVACKLAGPFRHVGIGELKIGARTEQLKALLGSCVGIAFLWKKRGRYGLAHCLLAEAAGSPAESGARYVSQAVPSLLRLIGAGPADYADIAVVVAGGGMMFDGCSSHFQIGQQNADAARKYLHLYGLNVREFRVGGRTGRTITVDCASGDYRIENLAPTSGKAATHVREQSVAA